MKKKLRKKDIATNSKKFPYLLTSYNKYYSTTPLNIRSNKSSHNKTHNKLTINISNTFSLFNPDEEYVTKLNFFNIGSRRDNAKKATLYNLNTFQQFPSIIKKDHDNAESFKEKKRILNELNSKKTMFDKQNNSEGSKQTYVNRYENTFKENQLEKERKEIEKKMYKLKEMIKSLSNELSITIKEIDNLKLDVEIMQNYRSFNLFANSNKKNENKNKEKEKEKENNPENKVSNLSNKKLRNSISKEGGLSSDKIKSKEKENKFKMEMKLLSQGEKVSKIKQEMKMKIKDLQEKKLSLLDKIDVCENELKKFKEKHLNVKEELLVHYHKLLSEGKDTRKDGLSWIILAIWNLKSNVLLSYLPKFLDQNIILFLFEYSTMVKKIKDTEKKIQELVLKLKEHKENIKNNQKSDENIIKNIINKPNDLNKKDEINNNNIEEKENNIDNNEEKEKKDINNNINEDENEDEEEDKNKSNKEDEIENNEDLNNDDDNDNDNDKNDDEKEEKINAKQKNSNKKISNKNLKIKEEIEEQNESELSNKENNEEKIINSINNIQEEEKEDKKYPDNNQQTKFVETFKTSLYNTNSEKNTINNNLFFEKDKYKKGNNLKENNFTKNKENKREKELLNINNLPVNFAKSLFRKEDLYKNNKNLEDTEKKIKLNDFQKIINTKQSYLVDYKTFELFNEHKKMEKYYLQLKEKAEQLMKVELDRISKSFYLYDYGAKYNVDQKTVISALIGEDSVRNEYIRQKKQEKEYFKTLRELRNGKISQKK